MGNRECGRRDVQRYVLRYVLREMRWLALPFVDWARSRGGVHSRHEQLLVPRASSEGVWAFLCRCCMRSRVACGDHRPAGARSGREFPVSYSHPHPPRSRTRQPRPPSGQPPGSVSASLLVPRCRFAAPTRGRRGFGIPAIVSRAGGSRPHACSIACAVVLLLETYSETVETGVVSAGGPRFN